MKPTPESVAEFEAAAREQAQAERLWPMQPALQAKWLAALPVVRATTRGWLLDNPLTKEQCNAHD